MYVLTGCYTRAPFIHHTIVMLSTGFTQGRLSLYPGGAVARLKIGGIQFLDLSGKTKTAKLVAM